MGIPVLVMGKSGSGKSTSLRNFNENEIGLINVLGKPLPFKGKIKSICTADYGKIKVILTKAECKTLVIDDAGYLITSHFMENHSKAGAGNAVFSLYNEIGDQFWSLIEHIKKLPEDKVVYFIMHEDKNDFGEIKPKTIGRLLDEKVCLEGMFTIVLRSIANDGKYVFSTQSNGLSVCKSPIDMFEKEIDNDLKFVDETIRKYYEIGEAEK